MFSDSQLKELNAPLSASHVKKRDMGGRKVSFIEGWHAIAEANRIFGFDKWSRETVELRMVSEKPRDIGQNKTPGWGVSYIARVRITVWNGDGKAIVREGCGSGHGIDRDLGQAHEGAIKEAETDAMKRSLMTFGNPFGLALYDKEQAGVEAVAPSKAPSPPLAQAPAAERHNAPPADALSWGRKALVTVRGFSDKNSFLAWYTPAIRGAIQRLGEHDKTLQAELVNAVIEQEDKLNPVSA